MLSILPACLAAFPLALLAPQDKLLRVTDAAAEVPGASVVTELATRRATTSPSAATPRLLPGWPKSVTTSYNFATTRGLCFEDLDGDGKKEIIRGYCNADNRNGSVYVWRHDGTVQSGWPVQTIGMAQYVPTVADLDGDGRQEIVVTTRGLTSGGRLYVFSDDGKAMPGWPKSLSGNNVSQSATCADLDGDGKLEIIALERAYPQGRVHVFRADGSAFPGSWPATIDHVPATGSTVADIDLDGQPEIIVASYNTLYCFRADGTLAPGWPYAMFNKHAANFSYQSPAVADLQGDGKLELVVCTHKSGSGAYVFDASGKLLPGWPQSFGGTWSYCAPTIVDLDGDGKLDVLAGRDTQARSAAAIWAWKGDGSVLAGLPITKFGGGQAPLTVADIDGDGRQEFFVDSSYMSNNQGFLDCYDDKGQPVAGFPIRTPGFTYLNGATIGDVDGDGDLEIGVIVRDRSQSAGTGTDSIYLYELPTSATPYVEWKGYQGSNARRGLANFADRFTVSGDAKPGGELILGYRGKTLGVGVALLGAAPTVLPIPGLGVLRLDLALPIQALDSKFFVTGRGTSRLPIPNNPALRGADLWLQGFDFSGGERRLNELRVFRIR